MNFFEIQGWLMLVLFIALLAVKGFAFVTSLLFPSEAYEAAGKMTKVAWAAILGLGFAAQVLIVSPIGLINLAFTIAAFVYLADVRPALRSLTRR